MNEADILQIIKSHESLTFPNGVGSTNRCINHSSYDSLAKDIVELVNRRFYNIKRGK